MKKVAKKEGVKSGLSLKRFFTKSGAHPFDQVEWENRSAKITDWKTGKVSFSQEGLEFPKFWSQRATDIVASKYFRGPHREPESGAQRQAVDWKDCQHHE